MSESGIVNFFYCEGQFSLIEDAIDLSQATEKLNHIKLYQIQSKSSHRLMHHGDNHAKLLILVIIRKDCIRRFNSTYHKIAAIMEIKFQPVLTAWNIIV